MNTVLSAIMILLVSGTILAQEGRKLVFWSGDDGCGFRTKSVPSPETLKCSAVSTQRGTVSVLSHEGLGLAVAFLEGDKYLIAGIQIRNSTPNVIGFDADEWGAAHFKDRAAFYKGEKPIAAETSLPSRDIIRAMAAGTKLDNSLGEFMGDVQVTGQTRDLRRSDGTRERTLVFVPDAEAKASATRQAAHKTAATISEQQKVRDSALTSKSVSGGAGGQGFSIFPPVQEH